MDELVVELEEGALVLQRRMGSWFWEPRGNVLPETLERANLVAGGYHYGGPADGEAGYSLCAQVARMVGGTFTPPLQADEPGEVY